MARAVLGYRNLLAAATLSTPSQVATLPLSNVINPHRAVMWRTAGTSGVYFDADFGSAVAIGAVGLFGTNFTAAATRRIRLGSSQGAGDVFDDGAALAMDVVEGYGQFVHVFPADLSARWLRVELADSGLSGLGYFDLGLAYAGPLFRPERNFSYGRALGHVDPSGRSKSRGGQLFVDLREKFRVAEFEFKGLREAEVFADALEIDRRLGLSDNLLFVPNWEGSYRNREAVFGPISDASPAVHAVHPAWAKRYRIEERL